MQKSLLREEWGENVKTLTNIQVMKTVKMAGIQRGKAYTGGPELDV